MCMCCRVQIAALGRADPPSKESYRLSVGFTASELINSEWAHAPDSLIRKREDELKKKGGGEGGEVS
jgi:hypothetical protein